MLQEKLASATQKVSQYLAAFGTPRLEVHMETDEKLDALATHRYPDTVVVKDATVPESVIAHELVHIAQGTLEFFRGFRLLYTLLAEGLAEFIARELYLDHEIKYPSGYELIAVLVEVDREVIGEILHLNGLPLGLGDLDHILGDKRLPAYTEALLRPMAPRIREGIQAAHAAGITDPTFVTLGEEVRAWKFLLAPRFEPVWGQIEPLLMTWFESNGFGNTAS